jgi:hypothetical protein
VLTFNNDVVSGSAAVTGGSGTISGTAVSGNTMIVNLTGVPNAHSVTISATNVTDVFGQTTTSSISMAALLGDTTGNGTVNASDIAQTKSSSGKAASWATSRTDVNASGAINASDIALVKSAAGTVLAP